VPPRLFSEVMRDLDLVVSVAHAGGVDPQGDCAMLGNLAYLGNGGPVPAADGQRGREGSFDFQESKDDQSEVCLAARPFR